MQVSVEKTSELSRKMTVSVPAADIQQKMDARFKKLAREVRVDGFRPGKVPVNIVKKLYGDRVKQEVTGDLIQNTYFEALQQQNLNPAGYPNIQPADVEGDEFKYVAEFEVYPEIALDGVGALTIARPQAAINEGDVDQMIEKLRQQRKTWQVVERASEQGDRVTIHFSGVCEGENFTGGKVEDYAVEIGGGQMIPGFEDQLLGLVVGASKTFDISFPEQYSSEKLAGKQAEFTIDLVKVEASALPELDEEFIKAYGVEAGDVATFRADVLNNMERELQNGLKARLKNVVMDVLYDNVTPTIPNALVDQEIQELMKPYAERAKKLHLKLEDLELPRETFEAQARRRVALGLILGEIIQKNSIQVDADRVRQVIDNMAQSYEKPEDVINWYYADKSRLQEVQQMVLEDQAVDWVISQAKVTDENTTFEDVMEHVRQRG
jgi:trigger factor